MNCNNPLEVLNQKVVSCKKCPRLIAYCEEVARVKRRAYLAWDYWGKPVPSFGDTDVSLLIVGLAPGAHGSNRTGRMFTGDKSGEWLYRALYETGFATQAESSSREDGLQLVGARITAAAHCVPPDNKPLPEELGRCRGWLERELDLLPDVRVVVALGRIAGEAYLAAQRARGAIEGRCGYEFKHDRVHILRPGLPILITSYHPSQQNTSTERLTAEMLRAVFVGARRWVDEA